MVSDGSFRSERFSVFTTTGFPLGNVAPLRVFFPWARMVSFRVPAVTRRTAMSPLHGPTIAR